MRSIQASDASLGFENDALTLYNFAWEDAVTTAFLQIGNIVRSYLPMVALQLSMLQIYDFRLQRKKKDKGKDKGKDVCSAYGSKNDLPLYASQFASYANYEEAKYGYDDYDYVEEYRNSMPKGKGKGKGKRPFGKGFGKSFGKKGKGKNFIAVMLSIARSTCSTLRHRQSRYLSLQRAHEQ